MRGVAGAVVAGRAPLAGMPGRRLLLPPPPRPEGGMNASDEVGKCR